jgi:hypothetical protein
MRKRAGQCKREVWTVATRIAISKAASKQGHYNKQAKCKKYPGFQTPDINVRWQEDCAGPRQLLQLILSVETMWELLFTPPQEHQHKRVSAAGLLQEHSGCSANQPNHLALLIEHRLHRARIALPLLPASCILPGSSCLSEGGRLGGELAPPNSLPTSLLPCYVDKVPRL